MTARTFKLSSGRTLGWYEHGSTNGVPVIFCTGAGMSGILGVGVDGFSPSIRLIAIDRPGLGLSDPDPDKTLHSWSEDVRELISQMSLDVKPSAIGFSQGAPFAYALANAGVVESLAIVSGQDDFCDPASFQKLPESVRAFVEQVQGKDPELLKFLANGDADGFFKLVLSMSSPHDQNYYGSEPFKSAYLQSLKLGFSQGADGYVLDLLNSISAWPFNLEAIRTPVHLWYGKKDANSTHSPDFGQHAKTRLPNSERTVLEQAGGSLLWTHTEMILRSLLNSR
jgi:pimeloyl-ACP methyl ester carboxylesterase